MLINDLHAQYSSTNTRKQTQVRVLLGTALSVSWIVLLVFNSLIMRNMVYDNTVAQLEETTALVVNRFEGRQDSVLTQLTILAKNFEAVDRAGGYTLSSEEILNEIGAYNPFDCFGFVDADGMEIDVAGYRYDDSEYPFFELGMRGQSGSVPVHYEEMQGYYLVYYEAIHGEDGQVKGVLTGFNDKKYLYDVIDVDFEGEEGLSFLTDHNGVILATNVDTDLSTLTEFFGQKSFDHSALDLAYENGEGIFKYTGIHGISYAAVKRVGEQDLYVVEGYPSLTFKNILASYNSRSARMISIAALITILLFLVYLALLKKRSKSRDTEYRTIRNILAGVNRMYEASVLIDLKQEHCQVLSRAEEITDQFVEGPYEEIRKRLLEDAYLDKSCSVSARNLLSTESLRRAFEQEDNVQYALYVHGYWINAHLCCIERENDVPVLVLLMLSDISALKQKNDFLINLPALIHGRSYETVGVLNEENGMARILNENMDPVEELPYEAFLKSYEERGLPSERNVFDHELQRAQILPDLREKKALNYCLSFRNAENVYETYLVAYRMDNEETKEVVIVSDRAPREVDVDPLTSAYTMHGMINAVETFLYANGGQFPLMLVHFNVRSFSAVNSLYDRKKGDQILCAIKEALMSSSLKPIAVARTEADSFLLLVKQEDFEKKEVDRLLSLSIEDQNLNLYCVVLRFMDLKNSTLQQLADRIALASETLRKTTKDSYMECTKDFYEEYFNEQRVLKNTRQAIEDQEFQIYYQPVVDAQTKKIVSAEALVRWVLPDGKIVPPSMFIPTLEKNNEIGKLDLYILRRVRENIMAQKEQGNPCIPCAVNLSRLDVINESVMSEVLHLIETSKLEPSMLRFEVTESVAAQLGERENYYLNKIRALGCSLLIDDFGAGSSSLASMCAQSFDILKMDMLFACQIEQSETARQTIIAMINYAHALGLKVIAEGVETQGQYEFLKDNGCDYIQGYYFSKPLAQTAFEEYMNRNA